MTSSNASNAKPGRWYFAIAILLLVASAKSVDAARPKRVSLHRYQTPIRSQGYHGTCYSFSVIAAMEAAYCRAGYGKLDLSERFTNHMGKMMGLWGGDWKKILRRGPDPAETQVGVYAGGNGPQLLRFFYGGFKVPAESRMPYQPKKWTQQHHPYLTPTRTWKDTFWHRQRRMNDVNFDEDLLPKSALRASKYYSIKGFREIRNPRSAEEIERVLASGREVIWDFKVINASGRMWKPSEDPKAKPKFHHSMLIVGYDRTSTNRKEHYFIVKNSWGKTGNANGYQHISYGYLKYANTAAYITGVRKPDKWPALANLGRWNLHFDGWRGTLDIYRQPGINQLEFNKRGVKIIDRRLGSFYDPRGRASKVNGAMSGSDIVFFMDSKKPQLRWDELRGRRFTYYRVNSLTLGDTFAGFHRDPDGRVYGGYMRRAGILRGRSKTPRPFKPASFANRSWSLHCLGRSGVLRLTRSDSSFLSKPERLNWSGWRGSYYDQVTKRNHFVRAIVSLRDPNRILLEIPEIVGKPMRSLGVVKADGHNFISLRHLNHADGVMAGAVILKRKRKTGAIAVRQ